MRGLYSITFFFIMANTLPVRTANGDIGHIFTKQLTTAEGRAQTAEHMGLPDAEMDRLCGVSTRAGKIAGNVQGGAKDILCN